MPTRSVIGGVLLLVSVPSVGEPSVYWRGRAGLGWEQDLGLAQGRGLISSDTGVRAEGLQWSGDIRLGLASPWLESDGWMSLPPDSVDSIQLREWYLGWMHGELPVRIGAGQRPDGRPFTPVEWPFWGVDLRLETPELSLDFLAQRFAWAIPEWQRSRPVLVQRAQVGMGGQLEWAEGPVARIWGRTSFDVYGDPDQVVSGFFIGRSESVDLAAPCESECRFRLIAGSAGVDLRVADRWRGFLSGRAVKNMTRHGDGSIAWEGAASLVWNMAQVMWNGDFLWQRIGACSLPPLALVQPGFPGEQSFSLAVTARIAVSEISSISLGGERFLGGQEGMDGFRWLVWYGWEGVTNLPHDKLQVDGTLLHGGLESSKLTSDLKRGN